MSNITNKYSDKGNNNKKKNDDNNKYITYGVGFGLLGGALITSVIGTYFETPLIWAFGPGSGMIIGLVIGFLMDQNKKKD